MTTKTAFQANYTYHLTRNYYGSLARPGEPVAIDEGLASGDLEPGDAVYYSSGFVKTDSSNLIETIGIVLYDASHVPDESGNVIIKSGSPVRVGIVGSFYAKAGSALTYGQPVIWDADADDWTVLSTIPAGVDANRKNPVSCADFSVADGELVVLRFHGPIR